MARIFEYFVVCGIGPEIRTLDGGRGFHGTGILYLPSLLDQYPLSDQSAYPPPPPQLSTCVLPAGVQFYNSGFDSNDPSSYPRSYPIVLTEGDASKIYVSCIAFRDPVCEDIAEAYGIPVNSFADKCICLVSRSPSFRILRDTLEEIFLLCFSTSGSRYWSGSLYIFCRWKLNGGPPFCFEMLLTGLSLIATLGNQSFLSQSLISKANNGSKL